MTASKRASIVAGACLLALTSTWAAADDKTVDLAGNYRCAGTNPDGGQYTGTVRITAQKDSYRIQWAVGSERYTGAGILDGDTFSVGWTAGGAAGVVSYKLQKDRRTLIGKWTVLGGDGKVFKETLTKM